MATPTETQVEELATALVQLVRVLRSARRGMPRVHPAVEPISYPVLYALTGEPMRVSEVAKRIFADVSTASRQVSALVEHGLIDKVPDPADGRAQLVTLSPAGRSLLTALNTQRTELFTTFLADWDAGDVQAFTGYLRRLTESAEPHREADGAPAR